MNVNLPYTGLHLRAALFLQREAGGSAAGSMVFTEEYMAPANSEK